MKPIVTANVWNRCQLKCKYCVSNVSNNLRDTNADGRDFGEVLDVDALIKWLEVFRPDADVNVSGGGEALLYHDIEDWMLKLIGTKRKVTLFTNGLLVHARDRLHSAPLGWIVTYHCGAGLDPQKYIARLSVLKGREDVSMRVLMRGRGDLEQLPNLQRAFDGFNIAPKFVDDENRAARAFGCPNVAPLENVASEFLTLIENDGRVYACNTKRIGPVGNIYAMNYDVEKARSMDATAARCWVANRCGACQTAKELF